MLLVDDATVVAPTGRKYFCRIEQHGSGSEWSADPGSVFDFVLGAVVAGVDAVVAMALRRRSARRIVISSQVGYTGERRRWKEWAPDEDRARRRFQYLVGEVQRGAWIPEDGPPPAGS